jgi:AraC family transcriptional regulator
VEAPLNSNKEGKLFKDASKNLSQAKFIETGFGVSKWYVNKNEVSYLKNDAHTISLYLQGGLNSHRMDKKFIKGGPGKICVMPQNQYSLWKINEQIEFIHIYISNQYLQHYAALNLDIDVRDIDITDSVYDRDVIMQSLILRCYQLLNVNEKQDFLAQEEVVLQLIDRVINRYNASKLKEKLNLGGLSKRSIKSVKEAVFDDISASHSINDLAALVNISPFHFAKMFKLSFGATPAQYILKCRLIMAKQLLQTQRSLTEVSHSVGFSHHSHMALVFKKNLGITPSFYRNNL